MAYDDWVTEVLGDIIEFAKEKGFSETERELSRALPKIAREIQNATCTVSVRSNSDYEYHARKC